MPIEIIMPALSPTMTEGNLARWVKKEGDEVKAGDVIAEIETDKATMEVEAADEGTLVRVVVPEGTEGIKVGAVIGLLLEEGEAEAAVPANATVATAAEPASARQAPAGDTRKPMAATGAPIPTNGALPKTTQRPAAERLFATPLARRLAHERGIDLAGISGSGPHGRIVLADLADAKAVPPQQTSDDRRAKPDVEAPRPVGAATTVTSERVAALAGNVEYELVPHTGMRRTIARRLTEAKQTVPHFYLTIDCLIDNLLAARSRLNEAGVGKYKLSVNDFVIRAAAEALRLVPAANASWSEDGTLLWKSADIGVAVAIEGGLITPIVKRAQTKGLVEISNEMRDLGSRAKAAKLKLEEFQGGTFSISNLGMYGIKQFEAVINPPHGAILAVGAGESRPVVEAGLIVVATVMSCTLSVDHRVVDGATGALFLKEFKALIEEPLLLLR